MLQEYEPLANQTFMRKDCRVIAAVSSDLYELAFLRVVPKSRRRFIGEGIIFEQAFEKQILPSDLNDVLPRDDSSIDEALRLAEKRAKEASTVDNFITENGLEDYFTTGTFSDCLTFDSVALTYYANVEKMLDGKLKKHPFSDGKSRKRPGFYLNTLATVACNEYALESKRNSLRQAFGRIYEAIRHRSLKDMKKEELAEIMKNRHFNMIADAESAEDKAHERDHRIAKYKFKSRFTYFPRYWLGSKTITYSMNQNASAESIRKVMAANRKYGAEQSGLPPIKDFNQFLNTIKN